jgi:hypothetical protein
MSLAFYMDEHVPRSITAGLRLRNVDVLTVNLVGWALPTNPLSVQ